MYVCVFLKKSYFESYTFLATNLREKIITFLMTIY